jgi:hypothetical protein
MITIAKLIKKFEPEMVGNGLRKQGWLISEMMGNDKEIYINVWGNKIEKYKDITTGVFYFSLSVKSNLFNGKYYTNITLLEIGEYFDDLDKPNAETKHIDLKINPNSTADEFETFLEKERKKGKKIISGRFEEKTRNINDIEYLGDYFNNLSEEELEAFKVTPDKIKGFTTLLNKSDETVEPQANETKENINKNLSLKDIESLGGKKYIKVKWNNDDEEREISENEI